MTCLRTLTLAAEARKYKKAEIWNLSKTQKK